MTPGSHNSSNLATKAGVDGVCYAGTAQILRPRFFVLVSNAQVVGLNGFLIWVAIAIIIIFDILVDPWIGVLCDRMPGARFT